MPNHAVENVVHKSRTVENMFEFWWKGDEPQFCLDFGLSNAILMGDVDPEPPIALAGGELPKVGTVKKKRHPGPVAAEEYASVYNKALSSAMRSAFYERTRLQRVHDLRKTQHEMRMTKPFCILVGCWFFLDVEELLPSAARDIVLMKELLMGAYNYESADIHVFREPPNEGKDMQLEKVAKDDARHFFKHEDLAAWMQKKRDEYMGSDKHNGLIVYCSGHGDRGGQLFLSDDYTYPMGDFVRGVAGEEFLVARGTPRPKVFIIDACQGQRSTSTARDRAQLASVRKGQGTRSSNADIQKYLSLAKSQMVAVFSSLQGKTTYADDDQDASQFTHELLPLLRKNADQTHPKELVKILRDAQKKVVDNGKPYQVGEVKGGFLGKVYLLKAEEVKEEETMPATIAEGDEDEEEDSWGAAEAGGWSSAPRAPVVRHGGGWTERSARAWQGGSGAERLALLKMEQARLLAEQHVLRQRIAEVRRLVRLARACVGPR